MGRGLSKGTPSGGSGGGGEFNKNQVGLERIGTLKEAIGTKGKPMGETKAVEGANPYYKGGSAEYTENCQRCVVATELRMRGYDVVAKPTYEGDTLPTTAFMNAKTGQVYKRYMGAFQGAKTKKVSGQKDFESQVIEGGSGSRYALSFGWKGSDYGHVINVVNKKGKVRYVDGQTGKYYSGKELWSQIKNGSATITRLDNLKISDRAKKSVEPTGRRKRGK